MSAGMATLRALPIFVFAYTIGTVGMLISNFDAGETRFPELEAAAASHLQACERGRAAASM